MFLAVLVTILTFIFLHLDKSHAEVFSSIARITSLINQESKLIDHLESIIILCRHNEDSKTQLDQIQRTLECLKQRYACVHTLPELVHNPVTGFRFLRRIVRDWNHIFQTFSKTFNKDNRICLDNLRSMKFALLKWQNWPGDQDIEGAALSLLTISETYNLLPAPSWFEYNLTSSACSGELTNPHRSMISFDCLQLLLLQRREEKLNLSLSSDYHEQLNLSLSSHYHDTFDKSIDSINTSCQYSYSSLPASDYLFVIKVSMKYQLYRQARQWLTLVSIDTDSIDMSERKLQAKVKAFEKHLSSCQNSSLISDRLTPSDVTQAEYLRMCRNSIEMNKVNQSTRPSNDLAQESTTCFWHSMLGYIRYKAEILHLSPRVMLFYDVISDKEIHHIKEKAQLKLTPSQLHHNSRTNNRTRLWRVSQTAWLSDETDIIQTLSKRVGHVTGLDTRQQTLDTSSEPFQVVNYGLGGLYVPHQDSVRAARALGQEDQPSLRSAGDRLATWMFYLSDVQIGGATVFPILKIFVKPTKGSAIFWYNIKRNGEVDTRLVHAACPVLLGDKWVANKWIRERGQTFNFPCTKHEDT